MRNQLFFLFALGTLLIGGCTKDECSREMKYYLELPVYMTKADLRQATVIEPGRALERAGKIYVYGTYLFVNEYLKGIHVIDNSNAASPQSIAFLNIPGNVDMAVQNNILYADNYIDLVAFDISNPAAPTFFARSQDVFPTYWQDPNSDSVLVGFEQKLMTETVNCGSQWSIWNSQELDVFYTNTGAPVVPTQLASGVSTGGKSVGLGGSMARFTLSQGHLYVVSNSDLHVFALGNDGVPSKVNQIPVGWNIETIFPYTDKLFLGSSDGMYIFDNVQPAQPTQLSFFGHARACDPVFVKDNYAYVTLRSGNACDGFNNQLDLVDITNLTSPTLVTSFPMQNPHGLSINENELYLCEGEFGVKAFDITDPTLLSSNLMSQISNLHAYDVITLGDRELAIVVGNDGLYQFDISTPTQIKQLSKIATNQ